MGHGEMSVNTSEMTTTLADRDRMQFGEGLRKQREARGIALEEIADATRISNRHLRALEESEFAQLPGGVFNRGIVRSYARVVGLDEAATLEQFQQTLRAAGLEHEPGNEDLAAFAENVSRNRGGREEPSTLRVVGTVSMVIGVLLLSVAVYVLLVHRGIAPPIHLAQSVQARSA